MRCNIEKNLPEDPLRELARRRSRRTSIYTVIFMLGIAISLIAVGH